jgi:hypothetical protein
MTVSDHRRPVEDAELATDERDIAKAVAVDPSDEQAAAVEAAAVDDSGSSVPPKRLFEAEAIEEHVQLVDERTFVFRLLDAAGLMFEFLFGAASMLVILAFLATVPVLQLLSLGYLLEASGRIARSGKLRDGFQHVFKAGRVGSIVLGTSMMMLPLWFVSGLWYDAQLIAPGGGVALGWRAAQLVLTVLVVGYVIVAWFCGGRLRHFYWPFTAPFALAWWVVILVAESALRNPRSTLRPGSFSHRLLADVTRKRPLDRWWFVPAIVVVRMREKNLYLAARDSVWEFVAALRLPYHFWLGARGFFGALVWLVLPITLLALATSLPPGPGVLAGLLGGLLLSVVLVYLPFLQTNFAAENHFVTIFDLGQVHDFYRRAPFALFFALLITLAGALPLYLLKIEALPREVTWLPSLVFVAFIFPARLLSGWAVGRARHLQPPRWLFFRVVSHLFAMPGVPVAMMYALMVFFTQYLSWYGSFSLYEQHAFLVPVPMLGG